MGSELVLASQRARRDETGELMRSVVRLPGNELTEIELILNFKDALVGGFTDLYHPDEISSAIEPFTVPTNPPEEEELIDHFYPLETTPTIDQKKLAERESVIGYLARAKFKEPEEQELALEVLADSFRQILCLCSVCLFAETKIKKQSVHHFETRRSNQPPDRNVDMGSGRTLRGDTQRF